MEKICAKCKINPAEEFKLISFKHQGLKFRVLKQGGLCSECVKKEHIRDFDFYAKGLVDIKGKEVKINWDLFIKSMSKKQCILAGILLDIEIFSSSPQENWEIVVGLGPIGLNPRASGCYLYFVRKEDIIEYARLRFSNTQFNWQIRYIGEVIEKDNIL